MYKQYIIMHNDNFKINCIFFKEIIYLIYILLLLLNIMSEMDE
jgi:hypothetical protein